MPNDPSTPTQHLTSGESQVIEAFAQKYGEGHVLLACHVAFPMVLTADLVYKIWQNFRNYTDENGKLLEIPYIAVSDFLLSPLCRPSGYQRFEMPAYLRQALLEALQNDPDFGKPRLQELAAFLKHYIESTYRDADTIGQAIRNAQQLMVDAWLEPEKALQTLTQAFLESENAPAEQVRLSNLMQGFSIQWSSGLMAEGLEMPKQAQTVLRYSQGLSAFHKTGNAGHAADILKGIIQKGDSGLVLPLPGEVKTTMSRRLSQPQKGKLFALLIALDEYHPSTNVPPLRGCKSDARELANWVEAAHKAENSPWSEIRVELLFDEQATFSILEKRAELLQEIGPEDQVLIFFAGHARVENPEDETDLICYDSLLPNGQKLTVSRFRNLVLSNARQQPYITVVLDAEFTGYPNWLDPTNPKHVVFANTGLRENGYEVGGSGGFFTKYFIDALVLNGGQVGNAALFVDTISGMAQDELSEKQHPQFYATLLGAERPFLQALDSARALKRQLRLSGASLADLENRLELPENASKQQWQSSLTTFLAEKEQTDAPLFLFVFSDADGDLPGVQQEMNQVKSLVEEQLQNTRIEAVILHNPDFQELQQYFTAPEYRNRLHWFHFSGLDKENTSIFQSSSKMAMKKANPIQQQSNIGSLSNIGDEPEGPAKSGFLLADGLLTFFEFAPWLVYQQNLRLVFINSCFSNHTAAWATQLGAWNAIGVEGEVSDSAATKFAVDFYSKWMVKGNALSAAFQEVLEASRNGAGPDAVSAGHRSAQRKPPVEDIETPADVPFQLKTASWLSTSWRGERFGDYNLIADSGLRALVFEYDTLDIENKNERVVNKRQLSRKIAELINTAVSDKGTLLGPHASQGLLAGLVSAIQQHPNETDGAVLLELAPMVKQQFVKYGWVEAVEEMRKQGMWREERNGELEEVLKGFEEGADEDLRGRIASMRNNDAKEKFIRIRDLIGNGDIKKAIELFQSLEEVKKAPSINDNISVLQAANSSLIRNQAIGVISYDEISKEQNRINNELLKLLSKLELGSIEKKEGSFTDLRDGHLYPTIEINGLIWMAQNLNYDVGEECWQDTVSQSRLYSLDGAKKGCPPGWRLPSDDEWRALIISVGGGYQDKSIDNRIIGDAGTGYFQLKNKLKIEEFPGLYDGKFISNHVESYWSQTKASKGNYYNYDFVRETQTLIRTESPALVGLSCRCVRELSDFSEPEMTLIKGGTFTMGWLEGRDGARDGHEIPTHEVKVNDFYIGKYPVTQAQWRAVMSYNPSHFTANEHSPVELVAWNDVQEFLKALNEKTGKNYRLPTEAEWEYAARGAQDSKGYEYAGSNSLDDIAWYAGNADKKTHPVGLKKPNELELYDMSGNVWEWVEDDWHKNYEGVPTDGSAWIDLPERGSNKVCRGGSWNYQPEFARCALRYNFIATQKENYLGFRLAHSIENFQAKPKK